MVLTILVCLQDSFYITQFEKLQDDLSFRKFNSSSEFTEILFGGWTLVLIVIKKNKFKFFITISAVLWATALSVVTYSKEFFQLLFQLFVKQPFSE